MSKIADIDKNFKIETKIDKDDIVFYNVLEEPFKIYGIYYDDGKFRRIPESVAKATNEGTYLLSTFPAGGRIRFKTDSPYIAVKTVMENVTSTAHGALTGMSGFDVYEKKNDCEIYVNTLIPPASMTVDGIKDGYEQVIDLNGSGIHELTINFPRWCTITKMYIGLSESSTILPPQPYRTANPIIFYGSSITQGGCASRPGNAYQNIISRRLNCDFINLGFSGNAKGEKTIADYIKDLDMSIFVYDYDHNAPTVEHLRNTHEAMFKTIREAQPQLPVIMLSRPSYILNESEKERLEIIRTTYNNAVNAGDKNVYFIPGPELMKYAENDGTVDGCHPNDFGFHSMAKVLGEVIEKILNDEEKNNE